MMPASNAAIAALDSIHARAVCDEIGERLRDVLGRDAAEIPPHLRRLVDRLAELERVAAPSMVPDIDDMQRGIRVDAAARAGQDLNSAK
jgi:hypothetical protein